MKSDVRTLDEIISGSKAAAFDFQFSYAKNWKRQSPERRIIGYLPVYIPREIFHAASALPVGIIGVGSNLQIIKGDAYYQSYICHLPRGVIELLLNGNLDEFDGFIFPAICDVIRNLSGMFKLNRGSSFIKYFDLPQNFEKKIGGEFYRTLLDEIIDELYKLYFLKITDEKLNQSISLYNQNRKLMEELYDFRQEHPSRLSMVNFYCILRSGLVIPVEEHNKILSETLKLLENVPDDFQDKIKVVVSGSFCEQPPLALIRTIENSGCYIVDDDFMLGQRWIQGDINAQSNDPLGAIADAYLNQSHFSSALYEGENSRGEQLAKIVKRRGADGVIFCAPSFCDPALMDRPAMQKALDKENINHINFQYHENMGQFSVIKEQAGTFSDSVKLWAVN